MKIHFNNLGKSDNAIKVSFDGGNSFQEFNVNDIQRNKGIHLDDSQNYSKIKIIGKASVIRDLDVVKDIDIPNNAFYLVVNSNYVKSIEYDGCGRESFSDGCGSDSYSVDDGYGENDSSFLGNVESVLVSPLWLKNVFNVDNFDPEFLSISNYSVQPFAYTSDETPILYRIPYRPDNNNNFVCYNDGTTKKFFKVSPIESENVAKNYPKFQLFFGDELVYEEQTTYVDNIKSKIQETIIDRHPEEFDGYDWKIYVNSEYSKSIIDKQFYMDSRYITKDYIIKIQDKQEHVYHYNAQYTEDNSQFSISWTKSTPALPDNPTKPFASFAGWYQDSSFSTPLNLGDVDRDGWIYAKWEYHDVTRKVIFEVPGLHLEFNVTRASNIELNMNDLISDIRNEANGCIKNISLVNSYNYNKMYFNTEEDFIIPADTFNVTFNKKTITLNYDDGTSKNFDYYNKPCTLGCKYEDLITGEKSILQDCIIATSNSAPYSVIDSQESFEELIASKNNYSVINLYENIIDVSNLEIEYTNIDKSNDTIYNNGSNSFIGLDRGVQIDAYISNEYIDSSNYETNGTLLASNIAVGSGISNAFTKIKNLKNNDKSIPGFRKIYLYCKPTTTIGQITSYYNYMNKSGSQVSKTASYNLGEDITVPSTYEEFDTMFSNALSTSRYSYDIDTTVPNKNTYKIWMEHNNVKYYSGSTIHIPEIPAYKFPTNFTAYYLPVAINYDSTVKSLTKDLIGHSIEENVDAEISFEDKPYYSAITPTVKISDNSCTIVDIENCIRNNNNYIFRTPFEVPMKFTVKDNFTQNFFYGKGSNDDAKNYILDNIETLQFYNGLGEELTTEQKQKILSLLPSNASSGQNRGVMLLEENLSNNTYSLPSINYGRFVINKDQLDVYNLENASADSANYVFYYGPDYDDTFSDWVIPSTTKYVELYFDVNEERYYDRTLTKVCNITDTNKIRSTSNVVYHNVNPDTYNAYKDFFVNDKISYINILFNSSNSEPLFYNSSYNYYSSLNWINNVIAGDEVKIGNEVIKYVVSIDDMYYYKAKIENGKIQLTLDASNWFEYDTEKYQLSELISSSELSISGDFYSRFNSTYYYSFNRNNKSIFAWEHTGSEVLYYPRATLSFDETLSYYKGRIYFENRSSNVIYGTDINLNNIKLYIVYKKGTGTTFVPRNLKYCIVEADAVEEVVEPVPEETPTTDEPTGSEESQES